MERPALLGGPAVRPEGPPPWPPHDPDVGAAVERALRDRSWGVYFGHNAEDLEQALREFFHLEHVLLCGSGTYAVELGLRALGVGAGDEVILASYDYPGNIHCVYAVGATPVLVDIDPDNWNLSLDAVREALGPATKAVLASHLHGGVVAMRELMELAGERDVAVLEDAAQCPGATVQGKLAGTWGDAGVISFGGSKLLTAGRGGALLSHRHNVQIRARSHWLRGNIVCPLSELQAAALVPQVAKLPERHQRRLANVARLTRLLDAVPGLRPFVNRTEQTSPGYYKLGFQYDAEALSMVRDLFIAAVRAEGIALNAGFAAQHVGRSPKRYRRGSGLSESERAQREIVTLHHPVLLGSDEDTDQVAAAIRKVYMQRELFAKLAQHKAADADSADEG
jgi:dTDP-4-amino-4,6-dideoxygalactose transaminase